MRQDITDLEAVYDGRYCCEKNVYRGGLQDNEQEEHETGERELRGCPAATDRGERGGIEGEHTGHGKR